ncbi:YggS family pyridoxal phosphate-dependent enzyme [Cellulomonas sp. NS3]|uniref:YggS family pyridoxal phosphate-dependent enzyme n=1 Tax=Cellulomonas sp. NS3 TaxID=2973977 RepID=UPI00216186A7|nr:YggS family pyridoxal phosphate-dependent enzyme [Cellulomonas sp. NS3]
MTLDDARAGVTARLREVRARLREAEGAAGRDPGSVRLLLATKTVPAELVRAAVEADAADVRAGGAGSPVLLGENRVQELVAKAPVLADLTAELHLIGPLQSNKVNHALRWATCVESVDTLELAQRLSERCVATARELDVLVQVNVSGEPTKRGTPPEEALGLATAVAVLPALHLRGLMTIGANSSDPGLVRAGYARLRSLRDDLVASGAPGTAGATGLSMGMSGDLELAVAEGATVVRIGTAVFGSRTL